MTVILLSPRFAALQAAAMAEHRALLIGAILLLLLVCLLLMWRAGIFHQPPQAGE